MAGADIMSIVARVRNVINIMISWFTGLFAFIFGKRL